MSCVRFVVASPSKFRDQFNAPKVSKELQSKRIDAASSLGVLDGLRRVEKVWDVPVRLSSSDASRAVEGCVASSFFETKGKVSLPVSLDPNTFSSSNKGVSCRK
jgi:hypothetical protein